MKRIYLSFSAMAASVVLATPYTGNDAASNAMGGTGVASARPQSATAFNPALLADYSSQTRVDLTLPSLRLFMEDSEGALEIADNIEAMDIFALNNAINGDGVTEGSITEVMTTITMNIIDIENALTAIQASSTDDDSGDIESLLNASDALTLNSATLDNKVTVIDTETENLSQVTDSAYGLDGKPLQLGLGLDILNVALPKNKLAMAFSVATNTTIGASIEMSDSDREIIDALILDLSGLTVEASELTTELNTLAALNSDLANHIASEPEDELSVEYATWVTELATLTTAVSSQGLVVSEASNDVSNYDGSYLDGTSVVLPDDDLTSEVELVGTSITELAVSFARRYSVSDQEVSVGITPKILFINVFEQTFTVENSSDEADSASDGLINYFNEGSSNFIRPNIDVGVTKTWAYRGQIRAGAALKDIIPWDLETVTGKHLWLRPKLRIGLSHQSEWTTAALDLDITENQLSDYNVPTRYLGIGGELRASEHAAIRAGYRNNLSVNGSHVISGGFSLTPWGVGLEVSAWTQPSGFTSWTDLVKDVGTVVQISARF